MSVDDDLEQLRTALAVGRVTLRLDVPVFDSVDELAWKGPGTEFVECCQRMNSATLHRRALAGTPSLAASR